MCHRRRARALLAVAAVVAAAAACSQASTEQPTGAAKERLAKAGLQVVVPRGWQGRIARRSWLSVPGDRGGELPACAGERLGGGAEPDRPHALAGSAGLARDRRCGSTRRSRLARSSRSCPWTVWTRRFVSQTTPATDSKRLFITAPSQRGRLVDEALPAEPEPHEKTQFADKSSPMSFRARRSLNE